MDQPVEYVGGQPEAKRHNVWPYAVAGVLVLGLLAAGSVALWQPMRSSGRALGDLLVPYSVAVEGQWLEDEKVVGRPSELSLELRNTDSRGLNGFTLRLKGLAPAWSVLSATADGQVSSDSVFFPAAIGPGETKAVSVKFMPNQAGRSRFQLTFAPGHGTTAMRLNNQTSVLNANTVVRDARPTDLVIRATLYKFPLVAVDRESNWDLQVENTGNIRITSITVRFADLPRSFEVTSTSPDATVSGDGRLVRFPTTLDPGQRTTVSVHFRPHSTGQYHVAAAPASTTWPPRSSSAISRSPIPW